MESESLMDAMNKITPNMLRNIPDGEEVKLNEEYSLYSYLNDPVVMLMKSKEWEEIHTVMLRSELEGQDEIVFL